MAPLPSLQNNLQRLLRDKRGATAIITAAALTILCGVVGLGLDTAIWYTNAHQLQVMTETSALSAGRLLSDSTQTSASVTAVAQNNAMLNGFTSSTDSINVSVTGTPPTATGVKVNVTRSLPRLFSALYLNSAPSVTASATAGPAGGGGGSSLSLGNVCILVLDATSSQTLLVNSNFNLNAPSCEIDVASKASTAAMFNSKLPNVQKVCVAGGSTQNAGSMSNLTNNCTVAANPFKNQITAPTVGSCTVNGQNYSGTNNLSPGVYCGTFNFNGTGTLNLAAGTYIFKNTHWNINSGWTVKGTDVTIYYADANSYIQFNSGVTVSLTAPTSGTYNNILMFEPDSLSTSQFAIDGTSASGHALQGLIYLPSRNITFNSTYSGVADLFTLVVNQLIFDTNSPNTWNISPVGGVGPSTTSSSSTLTN